MTRAWVLWLQFWTWLSDIGKIKPVVYDGTEALTEIRAQFYQAQLDLLKHQAAAEYNGAMVEMLYYRRKRLSEDAFCKGYFEPEEDLPGEVPPAVLKNKLQ